MRKILKLFMTFVFACCLFVGVNPAEAGLISREQEIEMGQQTAQQLEAQYGVSQDAALQERVNRIGQRLAKVCGRVIRCCILHQDSQSHIIKYAFSGAATKVAAPYVLCYT